MSSFQDIINSRLVQKITQDSETIIQSEDVLSVHVTNQNKEASCFFNVVYETTDQQVANTSLVDAWGNMEMALKGTIKIIGKNFERGKILHHIESGAGKFASADALLNTPFRNKWSNCFRIISLTNPFCNFLT